MIGRRLKQFAAAVEGDGPAAKKYAVMMVQLDRKAGKPVARRVCRLP